MLKIKTRNRFWLTAALLGIAMTALAAVQSAHAAQYTIIQLTDNAYSDVDPQINDRGQVVWRGWDGADWQIFLYDGTTTIQLTGSAPSIAGYDPQINVKGQVVWRGYDGGGDAEIFLYDGTNTIQLTNNAYDDWFPQINSSGQVVWQSYDTRFPNTQEIFFYDGTTTIQLTTDGLDDWCIATH